MHKIINLLHFTFGLIFILLVQGTIPFLTLPTLGQAVWTTGFAQSFANSSFLTIYAHNFGYPAPAPISFGLSAAWPISIFIRMGIHPADAYTLVFSIWFIVSYLSTFLLLRKLGSRMSISINGAILWLVTPTTWAHGAYSMLSLGIALLPAYFYATLLTLDLLSKRNLQKYIHIFIFFFLSTLISVFMDGYSFMMFALSAMIILISNSFYNFYRKNINIFSTLVTSIWMIISFGLSYILYKIYITDLPLPSYPLNYFKNWGADITFFILPTKGLYWFWDKLELGLPRTVDIFFGDNSVWNTTFILPLIVAVIILIFFSSIKKKNRLIIFQLTFIAFVSFYLSLGPSLKINLQKSVPETKSTVSINNIQLPTGSSVISKYAPGFKTMRASYRWSALTTFSLVIILTLLINDLKIKRFNNTLSILIFAVTTIGLLPNLEIFIPKYINNRIQYTKIELQLIEPLQMYLPKNEIVTFLPRTNDFLINLVSAQLKIKAHNVGGDKNIELAKKYWPPYLKETSMGDFYEISETVINLLDSNQTNVVVLPTIDTLWAAHIWPYPEKYKNEVKFIEDKIKVNDRFQVISIDYYLIIKKKI